MKYFLLCLAQAAAISLAYLLLPLLSILQRPQSSSLLTEALRTPSFNLLTAQRSEFVCRPFFSLTKEITQALIRAHQRGVKVDVIIDKKMPKKNRIQRKTSSKPVFRLSLTRLTEPRTTKSSSSMTISSSPEASISSKSPKPRTGKPLNFEIQAARRRICQNWEKHFSHSVLAAPERERHRSASHKKSKLTHQFVNLDDVLLIKREEIS